MLERELILDRYRIIGKAGAGGYATVQHAFDTRLKRDVAIKCIRITRADVDAAKRTAAILKQIDPLADASSPAPSIPIGSSRVIPAGGATAARIRRDATRSVYGKGRRAVTPAFGALEGNRTGALPNEPSFLSKREERLSRGRAGRTQAASRAGFRAHAAAPAPVRTPDDQATQPTDGEGERIIAPRDIPSLADMLPGAIKGAGETKISGVDSDAVSISLDMALLMDEPEEVDASVRDGALAGLGGIPDLRGIPQARPSFLDDMDEDEAARWKGRGMTDADYHRNLALGGVNDLGFPAAAQRPSVAAVQQWQERAEARQRHEQAMRPRNVARVHGMGASDAHSQALTPEELSQLDTVPGLEEARTAAHLNDANIVTVYDCVVEGDMAYVIMEYVEGKTLARLIRELGDDVTLDMVSAVFSSVAHALEVAHKANVLHLDIKPENVIVNKEGVVKVTDFGLSTLMDGSGQGKTGGGTIGYMPLEQMRRQPLDVRTDEWALASLTYEMLTGSNPFRARTLSEAETAIEDAEIILPSRCWDGMDEEVDDVMFTALSPDAVGRYETVPEFARLLAPLLANPKEGSKQLGRAVAVFPVMETPEAEERAASAKGGLLGGLFGRAKGAVAAAAPAGAADAAQASSVESPRAPRTATASDRFAQGQAAERPVREQAPRAPRVPLIDRLGQAGAGVVMRAFAAASALMIAVVALINFRIVFDGGQSAMQDTTFGLFSTLPIAAWVAMAALAALAFWKPKIGFVAVYLAFVVSLVVSQAWTAAFLLLAGMGAWWWFFGRGSDAACTLVMMQPLLGSVGFAAVVPVAAGAVLDLREALAAAGAAVVSALVFASLGSGSLANWEVLANFIVAVNPVIAGAAITNGLIEVLTDPVTWTVALSWVLGAGAFSLFCAKGSKAFDLMGSIACGILLVCGMLIAPFFLGDMLALLPLSIVGAVVPALLGVALAFASVTDRVRMAEGEW